MVPMPVRSPGARVCLSKLGAGVEVAPLHDPVNSDRCQGKAQVGQRDIQGEQPVLGGRKEPGQDEIRSGKAEARRSVDDHRPERGRVPQTPHALAPEAFDSIMV